jgi:hypothetical protein
LANSSNLFLKKSIFLRVLSGKRGIFRAEPGFADNHQYIFEGCGDGIEKSRECPELVNKGEGHSRHRSHGEEIASVIPFPRKDGFLFDLFLNWARQETCTV